jgi:hypothetical protein
MDERYLTQIKRLQETLQFEREEFLSHTVEITTIQEQWKFTLLQEVYQEITKLREELIKSRRKGLQKEREVIYLQQQLNEAVLRLQNAN